ncbi:hexosaminidase [Mucilaginibacter lappiensis]|uniref:beta-N-acetylhexosaminidase n=1 Tax=Mucilaginibacter lappiensis TaxID=354630 RepID=A0ABR6PF69_9SPHI|nr:family 20 glycosylhydrolase [Mucilaginibacter lappiensis]MBB6108336.1 hexosaminidase [Mucilaginibacter lappiensis]SIQ41814.1 hexosaminidase [Mucilaginibacter lappiensis]
MKKNLFLFLLILVGRTTFAQQADEVTIVPKPAFAEKGVGQFIISQHTSIVAKESDAQKVAGMFNYFFKKRYGFTLNINNAAIANTIVLNTSASAKTSNEGYQLKVTNKGVNIVGNRAGVFYGVQSLLQLIQQKDKQLLVPVVNINDEPNFSYRGLMLDVGRHFFDANEIKKILDVMASLKLNTLHWHLTDDQGWRLEIKKYPKLTTISAWRDSTIIGQYYDFKPFIYDGKKSGGFYTQEQAREIVKYATERNIEVIPEIEMPGHCTAVLTAYPELGNGTGPYKVPGYWGVHNTIYNPGEPTFQFLQDVLTEVMAIFPSKYIHIGGDEVPKDEWKTSALAQKIIHENKLKDEHELQSWFINRIEKFLNKNGKSLIGWDEILEGGLTPNATVMSWRGEAGGIQAAKEGHNVIMSPNSNMYIDHAQAKDAKTEPLAIGGFLPLDVVYNYNPRPAALDADQQKHILGVQANMWTEYISTNNKLEYMLFPRAIALAEVGWTKTENKNYEDFTSKRLPLVLESIEKSGINYRIPEANVIITDDAATKGKRITITPFVADSKVYYTVDGHKADNTADLYSNPILSPMTNGKPLTLKYIIVTRENKTSNEFSVDIK